MATELTYPLICVSRGEICCSSGLYSSLVKGQGSGLSWDSGHTAALHDAAQSDGWNWLIPAILLLGYFSLIGLWEIPLLIPLPALTSLQPLSLSLLSPPSTLICSNETVNIWSHLFGLVYFTLLMLDDNFSFLPDNGGDWGDHLTFTILSFCFQVSFS